MSSSTLSVIRETVSLLTEAPYTSAKWALISPVVNPRAYSDNTTALTIDRALTLTWSVDPNDVVAE